MEKIWKKIERCPLVEVSNYGELRSLRTKRKTILKGCLNSYGLLRCNINLKDRQVCLYPHRETALAFLPNTTGRYFVLHKDGNKLNNCVENLEWCSHIQSKGDEFKPLYGEIWKVPEVNNNYKVSNLGR